MEKHTIYRFDHLPANFNKLAQAVWWYFDGSHNLLEVDGKLAFTDLDEEEINSGERDLDSLICFYEAKFLLVLIIILKS